MCRLDAPDATIGTLRLSQSQQANPLNGKTDRMQFHPHPRIARKAQATRYLLRTGAIGGGYRQVSRHTSISRTCITSEVRFLLRFLPQQLAVGRHQDTFVARQRWSHDILEQLPHILVSGYLIITQPRIIMLRASQGSEHDRPHATGG